jgi:hypothetical protein
LRRPDFFTIEQRVTQRISIFCGTDHNLQQTMASCKQDTPIVQHTASDVSVSLSLSAVRDSTPTRSHNRESWKNGSASRSPIPGGVSLDEPLRVTINTSREIEQGRTSRRDSATIEGSGRRPRRTVLPSAPLRNSFVVRSTRRGSEEWRNLVKPFVADLVFRSLYQSRFQGDFKFRPYTTHAAVVR